MRITSISQSRPKGTRINGIFCERVFIDLFQIIEYLSKANQFLLMTFCVSVQIVFFFRFTRVFFCILCLKILPLIFFHLICGHVKFILTQCSIYFRFMPVFDCFIYSKVLKWALPCIKNDKRRHQTTFSRHHSGRDIASRHSKCILLLMNSLAFVGWILYFSFCDIAFFLTDKFLSVLASLLTTSEK